MENNCLKRKIFEERFDSEEELISESLSESESEESIEKTYSECSFCKNKLKKKHLFCGSCGSKNIESYQGRLKKRKNSSEDKNELMFDLFSN
jgi:NADH pyrophosphatase NudC (nudix superfamily)